MAGVKISNLPGIAAPAASDIFPVVQAGVTYKETVTQLGTLLLPITGGTMTGNLILNADPTTALQAATKQYADNIASGLNPIPGCVAASTVALTVTYANGSSGVGSTLTNAGVQAAFSIDGVSATVGQRVLIKDQASSLQNGIYTVTNVGSGATNWVLTRATDYDTAGEISVGDWIVVSGGTVNTGSSWLQTATVTIIGTDAITFTVFFSPSSYLSRTLTAAHIYVGNGSNIGTDVAVSGDLTLATSGAFTIANNAVSNAKLAQMATLTIKGNNTGGTADALDLTVSQVNTMLGGVTGKTFSINVQRVTASGAGTYTPTANMVAVIVQSQAAGGGAGGCDDPAAVQFAFGAGGGGGEYIEALFTAAQIGASKPYVVGAKGIGGAAGNNNGTSGGNTTFNTTWIIATGGGLGTGGASAAASQFFYGESNTGQGGQGGSVATGTLIAQRIGGNGGTAFALVAQGQSSAGGNPGAGGSGASSKAATSSAGDNGALGGGGAGASSYNASGAFAGGDGGDGFITFIEFIFT